MYPFRVYNAEVEGHRFWAAESTVLKGCVGQGDTIEEAIKEFNENEKEWLANAESYGIPIPEIPVEKAEEYSGKFTVRVAPYIHKEASEMAKKQAISLTQYVSNAIAAQNSKLEAYYKTI